MAVLKTRTDNERAEIEFALDYLASLTTQQRSPRNTVLLLNRLENLPSLPLQVAYLPLILR